MTPNLQIEYRPIDALLPYARNPRTHSAPAQIAKIAASIAEYGWTQPDPGRWRQRHPVPATVAWPPPASWNCPEVPVIELGHLTAAQKRAYVLADNRLALEAGWDDELLALELAELSEAGYDLQLTGFDEDEFAKMLANLGDAEGS
jgi:ParB-like chromosome segregation protein Spo0J